MGAKTDRAQRRTAEAIAFTYARQKRAGLNLRSQARGAGTGLSRFAEREKKMPPGADPSGTEKTLSPASISARRADILAAMERVKRDPSLTTLRRDMALRRLRGMLDDPPAVAVINVAVIIKPAAPPAPPRAGHRSALRWLLRQDRLPPVFCGEIVPLAIGIRRDLHALLPLAISHAHALWLQKRRAELDRWLRDHTSRAEYLEALAKPGAQRYRIDGTAAGEVSEPHRQHAADRIAALAPRGKAAA